jgi:AcrR family transcriptional regulator
MTNVTAASARPAHRPSRRSQVIDSAMRLFARVPFDDVTVADIADAAGMTPAAVYYHFDGKEQILLEGIGTFSAELLSRAQQTVDAGVPVGEVLTHLLDHIRKRQTSATVFFINSAGLNLAFEAHRKTVRAELAEMFSAAARQAHGHLSKAEAGVMGAALVSLLEVSSTSLLGRDQAFRSLGTKRLRSTVNSLAHRIVDLQG